MKYVQTPSDFDVFRLIKLLQASEGSLKQLPKLHLKIGMEVTICTLQQKIMSRRGNLRKKNQHIQILTIPNKGPEQHPLSISKMWTGHVGSLPKEREGKLFLRFSSLFLDLSWYFEFVLGLLSWNYEILVWRVQTPRSWLATQMSGFLCSDPPHTYTLSWVTGSGSLQARART